MNPTLSAGTAPIRPTGRTLRNLLGSMVAALAIVIAAVPGAAAETVLRVAYPETENPPRITGRGAVVPADQPGITIELLRMAAEKAGVTLELARAPWKRCLYLLENAYVDATFHASYTEERTRYAVYPTRGGKPDASRAVFLNRYAIYVTKGSGIVWDGRTLANVGKPLGTLSGNAVVEDLKRLGGTVEEAPGVRSNMEKLQTGRIAAYVEIEG
ncbi:MAG: transporter substrate-binding domain-containing protein, partial [Rhodocyclaceae bacterium]|nr:transporter substrate-binding domain-containing protein [Rhodocyclaceae bacterium]